MDKFKFDANKVGMIIRAAREEKGMTLSDLADAVGKSVNHMTLVELGHRGMSVELIFSLMNVLDLDANQLLGVTDEGSCTLDSQLQMVPKKKRQSLRVMLSQLIINYVA